MGIEKHTCQCPAPFSIFILERKTWVIMEPHFVALYTELIVGIWGQVLFIVILVSNLSSPGMHSK